jgi:DNA polymerase-3 subunit beta
MLSHHEDDERQSGQKPLASFQRFLLRLILDQVYIHQCFACCCMFSKESSSLVIDRCFYQKDTCVFLTVAQKDFNHALSLVSAFVGQSTMQMPILKNLLLDAELGTLVIQAANDDTRICVRLTADIQAPGMLLLPAHAFARFVGDLPNSPVSLMSPSPTDQTAIQLRCQQIKANFKQSASPLTEFPQATLLAEGEELLTLDGELFKEIIAQVAVAAASNDARPVLEGISVVFQNGSATFTAADAFRLAFRTIPIPDQRLTASLLIPASVLRQLARVLPSAGVVRLGRSRDGRQLLMHTRDMDMSSRLMEGVFPNVRSLLALEARTRVVLPTSALANAVHLMTSFARENKQQLRWTVEATSLLLEAEAPDLGTNEVRLTEGVTISGPTLSILLNHTYVAEALMAVPTQQVALEMFDARRPVVIKPVGPLDARHIIMPLLLEASITPTSARPESSATSVTL